MPLPLMPAVWGQGQLLAYSGIDGQTDFDNGLTLRTSAAGCAIDVKLPAQGHIQFHSAPPDKAILTGDAFDISHGAGRTRGALLDAYHLLIEGPADFVAADARLTSLREGDRLLVGVTGHFNPGHIAGDLDAAMRDRLAWVTASPLLSRASAGQRPAVQKALSQIKTMIYSPEGRLKRRFSTPDRWPHRGMWLWDSAFHAIGIRHADVRLARDILAAVLDGQQPDGRVAIRHDPSGPAHAEFTQPPVLVLAAWALEQTHPDPAWLADNFPTLEAYVEWDLAHRDAGNGLPFWAIEEHRNCRSGESGMDNSPRFDVATRMEAVDFSSFLALECELLSLLAGPAGYGNRAAAWEARAAKLRGLIRDRLWSEEMGFFTDYDLESGRQSPVMASSGFLPLICGAATPRQAAQLAAHLSNPRTFGTPLRVPSIAANDTAHYAKDMWRGPVWMNVNWLIAQGLLRYGHGDAARAIILESAMEIERYHGRYGTFFEFFDDRGEVEPPKLHRKGQCAPEVSYYHQVFFDYGWTATLYLDFTFGSPLLPRITASA